VLGDSWYEIFQGAIRIVRSLEQLLHGLRVYVQLLRISYNLYDFLFPNAQLSAKDDADRSEELARLDGGLKIHVG